jgi:hypothetical protein
MTPTKQPFTLDAIYEVLKKVKSGAVLNILLSVEAIPLP